MSYWKHRASSFARSESGATLVELLVVLAIVSILAVTALPFAETAVQRRHETELRHSLREVRLAIDAFHSDWKEGAFDRANEAVSEHGFPATLDALVDGIDPAEPGPTLRYLRKLPENPFARDPGAEPWRLIGYAEERDALQWNGQDVWDIRAMTDKTALDGTRIEDW